MGIVSGYESQAGKMEERDLPRGEILGQDQKDSGKKCFISMVIRSEGCSIAYF